MMAAVAASSCSSSSSTPLPFAAASHSSSSSSSSSRNRSANTTKGKGKGKEKPFLVPCCRSPPPPPSLHNHRKPILRRRAVLDSKQGPLLSSLDPTPQQPPIKQHHEEEEEEEEEVIATAAEEPSELPWIIIAGDYHSRYSELLQQCAADPRPSSAAARALHAHMAKTGFLRDLALSTSLVNVYSKCGSIEDAHHMFDQIPRPSVVTWTTLLVGYLRNSKPHVAARLFAHHLRSGLLPTTYTLSAAISACSSTFSRALGSQIHAYAIKSGASPDDTTLGNALTSFYSNCRQFGCALRVFKSIPDKDTISWTTAIAACDDNGRAELGLRLFRKMLLQPLTPNEFTLTTAASLCCASLALSLGRQVHSMCVKSGIHSSTAVRNSLMYLYMKCNRLDDARTLTPDFRSMNIITWNSLISGYANMMDLAADAVSAHRRGLEALQAFLRLDRSAIGPDAFSYSSALTICSALAALEHGEQFHARIIKSGYASDVVVGSTLVDMYVKCGCVEKASRYFVEMPTRTLILWTSMIAGFSQHGRSEEALRMFEDMRLAGLRPNQVTFITVLCACSHLGLVDEAREYFRMMKEECEIRPRTDHYVCMVDMYVRLGRLEEAFDVVKTMELEPNEVLWTMLLGGCRSHGKKMDLAFYAADRLLELKPKFPETYGFLLSLYISVERWQDVSRVRKVMREEKIEWIRDWSWISIRDKVYSFTADDRFLSQSAQMRDLLEGLLEKAKGMGYTARGSLEVEEDEEGEEGRAASVVHHSEKLAIAFGLMNTADGVAVRVVKNTIMCGDSHNAIKFFSVLTGREIIVRDRKRLHRFKEGKCSCGDLAASI